jgi:hypothetical protein
MGLFSLLTKILIDDSTRRRLHEEGEEIKGFRGFLRVFPGHFHKPTLYNPLGLLAAIAFVASFRNPWWHATVDEGRIVIDAFGYALKHTVPPIGRVFIIETPPAFSVFMLLGVLVYFLIVFWGSTMAGRKGRLYVALGGALLLIYTAGFYGALLYALYRIGGTLTEDFHVYSYLMRKIDVDPFFLPTYYWTIGAAIVCLLSSLIHGWLPIRFYRRKKQIKKQEAY